MADIKNLKCDGPGTATATYTTNVLALDCDIGWDAAKEAGRTGAAEQALKAALQMKCPEECPKRTVELSFTPSDPVCNPKKKKECECTVQVVWSAVVTCGTGKTPDKALKGIDVVELPQPGKNGIAKPKRLPCSNKSGMTGQGTGSADSTTKETAIATARQKAEDNAYEQLQQPLKLLKCRGRCPKMKVTIEIGPSVDVSDGKYDNGVNEYFYATATCNWQLTMLCS